MTGHGAKFGRKIGAAVAALLTHRTTEEAARAVGVSPKTLLRWQQIPEFQAALRKAQQDALAQTTARLLQGAPTAAAMLMNVMVDPATPALDQGEGGREYSESRGAGGRTARDRGSTGATGAQC